ncbi:hypothetical protein [Pseudodesulfovibrio piezophilus]|uniref:Cobalt transport protein n=1 Tax=Pseudodesulfovibrio piezophilus (strain DSM 21447 / JCM 15486 / C1TLV30) TaxID=1322246 RepID=M1WR55_PSEP2|nr:hypothetical protein [Pseudodesulfovibrio piezophilus]CCH48117.1 Cobalt transport protein [Pseudodesulfovibrio piezophilus C1TLV30]
MIHLTTLDARLKMATVLVFGPCMWWFSPMAVFACVLCLLILMRRVSRAEPLGGGMVRSLWTFLFLWIAIKMGLDSLAGLGWAEILRGGAILGLRLGGLLLLGLGLALTTSPRELGLAVTWGVRPVLGKERSWKLALSLSLMVHFLPLCLATMNQVKMTLARRCPHCCFVQRMIILPQAMIRNLGQKTWSQTLVIAGRRLESADAWEPDFEWSAGDTLVAFLLGSGGIGLALV